MQQYSELEKMILRTKEAEFEAALERKLTDLASFLGSWVLPKEQTLFSNGTAVDETINAIRAIVDHDLCADTLVADFAGGHMHPSPIHEYMLSDFGQKALTFLKSKAGR